MINDKVYDTLKVIALAIVPILAFIASLVTIWDVPNADKITASLTALDTLVSALVVVLNTIYKKKVAENVGD